MPITLEHLRRYAIARSLFKPTTLGRAIDKLGFVQADPIRAPARAQDLTLRHRVDGYRAGDLERRYPKMALEEDFFVNYGFLPRAHHGLMHPRTARTEWTAARRAQAVAVLDFIRGRGAVHPREVDAHFAHGKVTNWFGGSSNASTQLLDVMHYRGLLRVARRERGTRVYAAREAAAMAEAAAAAALITPIDEGARGTGAPPGIQAGRAIASTKEGAAAGRNVAVPGGAGVRGSVAGGGGTAGDAAAAGGTAAAGATAAADDGSAASKMDALVDIVVRKYAPLPAGSLGQLLSHLRGAAPQWAGQRAAALARAKQRLAHSRVEGIDWYWPAEDKPSSTRWRPDHGVRLLTPFDPVVWDRRRFEIFWGWAYRFEAYTPAPKRRLGYYALPLLWHESVIGWGNVTVADGDLKHSFGYISGRAPRDPAFRTGLEDELERMRRFLCLAT